MWCRGRRWRSGLRGVMRFAGFDMAGNRPFGQHDRIVFVSVAHNRVQGAKSFAGGGICVRQSGGRTGLAFQSAGLVVRRAVKIRNGLGERVEKIGGQVHGKKLRFHRRGVFQELAGGGQQRAISAAARHPKFGVKAGCSQIRQRVRAFADGFALVVQVGMDLPFGFCGLSAVALGRELAGGLSLRLRNGGNDEGELLSANAGGCKIRSVVGGEFFDALKCVSFVVLNICHNDLSFGFRHGLAKISRKVNKFFARAKDRPHGRFLASHGAFEAVREASAWLHDSF